MTNQTELGLHPEVPAEDGEDSSLDSQEEDFDWEDDPVVLFDPISGPVTDSQLRAIVESVRQQQGDCP